MSALRLSAVLSLLLGVVAMARGLGKNCSGLMTWDAGWDQFSGWQFANAVAAG
jgi:chitinase